MTSEEQLLELASAVAEGQEVDWEAVTLAAGSDDENRVLAALRDLALVVGAHRALHPEAGEELREWGHLEVTGKLGQGSFGEVFRARDTQLDREVALKLLRPSATAAGEDVLREARLLARLKHPNVATVYGADRRQGRVGLWMELLEGSTLAELVAAQGPFSAREAVALGTDLCRAVAAVHAQGIVHRDIKAQNVLREHGGRIVLTDFGVGLDLRDGAGAQALSGTPLYLAPELFSGGAASVSSDIYSLGVLLYHLVAGRFPVEGKNLEELRRAHEHGERQLLRDLRPELPEAFVRVVERALEIDPGRRFGSAGELEKALSDALLDMGIARSRRRWRLAAGLGVVAAAVALWWGLQDLFEIDTAARTRVLVAGWENTTGEDRFDDRLRPLMDPEVSDSPRLELVSRDEYRETFDLMKAEREVDPWALDEDQAVEIALRNNAVYVVEGKIQPADGSVEIVLRLLRASTGDVVEQLPRRRASDATVDETLLRLARDAVDRLEEFGGTVPEPLERVTVADLEALRRYSRAVGHRRQSELEQARRSLKAALGLEEFAMAYRLLANVLSGTGQFRDALDASQDAFDRLGEVTPAEQVLIRGTYYLSRAQYRKAIDAFRVADPSSPYVLRQIAMAHAELGELDEAVGWTRKARAADPQDVVNQGLLVLHLAEMGKGSDALRELENARGILEERDPVKLAYLGWGEGLARLVQGEYGKAREAFRQMARNESLVGYDRLMESQIHLLEDELERARDLLVEQARLDLTHGDSFLFAHVHHRLAEIHAARGEREEALRYLAAFDRLFESPAHVRHLRNAALTYVELGELEWAERVLAAIDVLEQAYPSLLSRVAAKQVRGELELARGELERAEVLLEDLPPVDARVVASRVRLYECLGDARQAAQERRQLVSAQGQILRRDIALLWTRAAGQR